MDRNNVELYKKMASCLFDTLYDLIDDKSEFDIDSTLLLQLSELDVLGRNYVERNASQYLKIQIDESAISDVLQRWNSKREDMDLEDSFLLLQASQKLMRELFGMHATTFSWRRKLLGLQGEGRHRPFYCDESAELDIWKLWHKYQDLDERDRYLKVANVSNHSIGIIAAAVKRYNEASIDGK